MTADQLASLAASLKDNEAFQAALDIIRNSAIARLIDTSPDDKNTILKAQATVAVVDDIRGELAQFIRSGAAKKPASIA